MSAGKVDVLAVMDRSRDVLGRLYFDFQNKIGPYASQANSAGITLAEARAAVAELIAADAEHDAAREALIVLNRRLADNGWVDVEHGSLRQAGERFVRAQARRYSALEKVQS